jgi:hypothetical protein
MKSILWMLRRAVWLFPIAVTASVPMLQGCGGGDCCKVCDIGKACGDTCIAANLTCTAGDGCACDK